MHHNCLMIFRQHNLTAEGSGWAWNGWLYLQQRFSFLAFATRVYTSKLNLASQLPSHQSMLILFQLFASHALHGPYSKIAGWSFWPNTYFGTSFLVHNSRDCRSRHGCIGPLTCARTFPFYPRIQDARISLGDCSRSDATQSYCNDPF